MLSSVWESHAFALHAPVRSPEAAAADQVLAIGPPPPPGPQPREETQALRLRRDSGAPTSRAGARRGFSARSVRPRRESASLRAVGAGRRGGLGGRGPFPPAPAPRLRSVRGAQGGRRSRPSLNHPTPPRQEHPAYYNRRRLSKQRSSGYSALDAWKTTAAQWASLCRLQFLTS